MCLKDNQFHNNWDNNSKQQDKAAIKKTSLTLIAVLWKKGALGPNELTAHLKTWIFLKNQIKNHKITTIQNNYQKHHHKIILNYSRQKTTIFC